MAATISEIRHRPLTAPEIHIIGICSRNVDWRENAHSLAHLLLSKYCAVSSQYMLDAFTDNEKVSRKEKP